MTKGLTVVTIADALLDGHCPAVGIGQMIRPGTCGNCGKPIVEHINSVTPEEMEALRDEGYVVSVCAEHPGNRFRIHKRLIENPCDEEFMREISS